MTSSKHTHTHTHTHTHPLPEHPTADLKQEGKAEDTVTFVCDVNCSVDYNVSWLLDGKPIAVTEGGKYQQYISGSKHKLIVKITSPDDTGNYTCVVNTVYKANETSASYSRILNCM